MIDIQLQWSKSTETIASQGQSSAVQIYDVICTSNETYQEVKDSFPLNTIYEYDTKLLLNSATPVPLGVNHYLVTCNFTRPPAGEIRHNPEPTTTSELTDFEFSPIMESKPFDRDTEGNPILNTAFDAISTPPQKKVISWQMTVTKRFELFNPTTVSPYMQMVNDVATHIHIPGGQIVDPETGQTQFAPAQTINILEGNCLCEYVAPTQAYNVNTGKLPIKAVFSLYLPDTSTDFDKNYWQLLFLSQGSTAYYNSNNTLKRGLICTSNGDVINKDVLLSSDGKPLDANLKVKDGLGTFSISGNVGYVPSGCTPLAKNDLPQPYTSMTYCQYKKFIKRGDLTTIFQAFGMV